MNKAEKNRIAWEFVRRFHKDLKRISPIDYARSKKKGK